MIYAYFDAHRVLKELINDTVNSGDSNVNKIAVYWENDDASYSSGIRYQTVALPNSDRPTTTTELNVGSLEILEIPYNRDQDLKYFKYGVKYGEPGSNTHEFRVFTIPSGILFNDTDNAIPVLVSVFIADQVHTYTLDRFAFNVGPSTASVAMDEHINLAEWNALVNIVFNKQLYVVQNYSDIVIANHRDYDMFFVVNTQKFYYIEPDTELVPRHLVEITIGGGSYVIDEQPTQNSENLVYSGGVYSWVLSQISQIGTLKAHICTENEDTPVGVSFDDVVGELDPQEAEPNTMYLVPDGDSGYVEYFPIYDYENETYSWEIIGKTSVDLPATPQQDGKYELMVNVATGVASYSWSNGSEFVITSSGTTFDLTDPRYKLKSDNKIYSYVADGKYACVSSPTTLSIITVDSSTYTWNVVSQSVTANNASSFTIGAITYTIPTVAGVVTVTDGGTADYNFLLAHKDYLLRFEDGTRLYRLFDADEDEGMLYYLNTHISGMVDLYYSVITVENTQANNVNTYSYDFKSVTANPTGTPTTWLDKIKIGTNSYNVALPEIIDLGTASSGTLTQAQYDRLVTNQNALIKLNTEYYRFNREVGNTYLHYVSNGRANNNEIAYYTILITKNNRSYTAVNDYLLTSSGIVPNPITAATDQLTSVNIQGTIYSTINTYMKDVTITTWTALGTAIGDYTHSATFTISNIPDNVAIEIASIGTATNTRDLLATYQFLIATASVSSNTLTGTLYSVGDPSGDYQSLTFKFKIERYQ